MASAVTPTAIVTTAPLNGALPADVPYKDAFIRAGKTCPGISAQLLVAQARIESVNFNRDVISGKRHSPAGAMGISQFMPGSWRTWGEGSPYDPEQAIKAQGKYMCALYKLFGSPELALAGYNAGPNAVKKYAGIPPYRETRNYIKRIEEQL